MPLTIPWTRISVAWLGIAHYLACIFPQLGSVLYHLFMNHEGGPAVYHTLLTLDMCGVCMVNTLGEFNMCNTRGQLLGMNPCLLSGREGMWACGP